jgi:hypothetical protein
LEKSPVGMLEGPLAAGARTLVAQACRSKTKPGTAPIKVCEIT